MRSATKSLWFKSGLGLILAGMLFAVVLWASVPQLHAFGGGIEVIEEDREVDFPSDLNFTITAEGDNEIVEVQLLYRVVGNSVWSYAYADLEPGSRISAYLDINIGGQAYLPPGVEIEYYYLINDAEGNSLRTDPQIVEYLDSSYDWDRTQIDSLTLLHHDLSSSRVASVSREVESAIHRIRELLQIQNPRPMRGLLYNSNSEAQDALPRQSQTITDQQVFGGFAFPASGIFVGVGFRTRIISHEAAHLLFDQAVGPDALPVPAWLDEGFASYIEPGSRAFSGSSLSSRGLPLSSMNRISGTPRSIETFYQRAESVVSYLIEEFGEQRFKNLVTELSRGRTTDQALVQTYGFDITGLETRWSADDRHQPAPAPGSRVRGNPWASSNTLIIGALALVVMVAVVVRYFGRKLHPAYRPEDRLQPWEDPDLLDQDQIDDDVGEEDRPR